MPMILDPGAWSADQLRERATDLRDGLSKLAEVLSNLPTPMANPWALEAGVNLARRSVDLASRVLEQDSTDATLLATVTNQLYEVGASFGYFMLAARSPPPPFPANVRK